MVDTLVTVLAVLGLVLLILVALGAIGIVGYALYALVQSARGNLPTQQRSRANIHPGGQVIVDEPGPELVHIPCGTPVIRTDPRDLN